MHAAGIRLDKRLHNLYAKELMIAGEKSDFTRAIPLFEESLKDEKRDADERLEAYCILARANRLRNHIPLFFKYTTKAVTCESADSGCSEICLELGLYYNSVSDYEEALIWFHAATQAPCILNRAAVKAAYDNLVKCCKKLGYSEEAELYEQQAAELD
jgi:tetratricopeptide (TPR) repeat protein